MLELKKESTRGWVTLLRGRSSTAKEEDSASTNRWTQDSKPRVSPREPISLSHVFVSILTLLEKAEVLVHAIEKRRPSKLFERAKLLKEDAEALLAVIAQTRRLIEEEGKKTRALEGLPAKKSQRGATIKVMMSVCTHYRASLINPLSLFLHEQEYREVKYSPYIQVASMMRARIEQSFTLLLDTKTPSDEGAAGASRSLTPIVESPQVKPPQEQLHKTDEEVKQP